LREDYLANLESVAELMPSLAKRIRFRLLPMNTAQALEAVLNPGGALVSEPVAHKIVDSIAVARRGPAPTPPEAADQRTEVEPFLLSLVCRELNNRRRERQLPSISEDLVAEAQSGILAAFYERCFAGLPPAVRIFVEDQLVGRTGYREMVALERALDVTGVTRPAIDTLVSRRMLRIEEDRNGVQRVELTHDVLTRVAVKSRDQRKLADDTAAEWERQKAAMRRRIIPALVIMLVLALGAAAFAVRQWNGAEHARQKAEFLNQQYLEERARAGLEQARAQEAARVSAETTERALSATKWKDIQELRDTAQTELAVSRRSTDDDQAAPDASAKPRVYIQIQNDGQRRGADRAIQALKDAQFFVPPIQTLQTGPDETEVRYFRKDEREEAERVARILTNASIANAGAKLVAGYENSKRIRPRHYEVWFGNSAARGASSGGK
jgi:hypothetical protein